MPLRSGPRNPIASSTRFGELAHLKAGTINFLPGQRIRQGDVLGEVGNSGNSSEPHVHLHLQDTPLPDRREGILFFFSNYVLDDGMPTGTVVARGIPEGGIREGRYVGDVVRVH
ncbi:MAG: M23 family metallopeptidase [Vicinamibacterales bacterium]